MAEKKTDQWKSGGDCKECRRQGYCKQQCKANQKHMQTIMRQALVNSKHGALFSLAFQFCDAYDPSQGG